MWVLPATYIVVGTVLSGLVADLFVSKPKEMLRGHGARTISVVGDAPAGPQFYVATTGNDSNPGTTMSAPWRTIQHAMNSATPGSTVNIMAGTYQERLTVNVSGRPGNYTTFQPYNFSVPAGGCGGYTGLACGGDRVVLDYLSWGTITDGVPFMHITNRSYVRIQGITFQNYTTLEQNYVLSQGLRIDGSSSFVEFKYNKFLHNHEIGPDTGCCASAHIRIWGPSNNVWFYGNELGDLWTVFGEALTADARAQYITVESNWVHDTDQIAIDMHGGTSNYTIRGNKLEYISVKRDGTVWYDKPSIAIYNDGANTGVMERNSVSYAGVAFEALSEPGQPSTYGVTVRNNITAHCLKGVVLGTWYSNVDGSSVSRLQFFNNTFYGNTVALVVRPMMSTSVSWENNLFANNLITYVNWLNWNPGNADYNLYFGGGAGPGVHVIKSDPLFVNPSVGNYTLEPASPAINAGDPGTPTDVAGAVDFAGNPRIAGGRVDIGAYEVQ
jgi:hypothetical protein